MLVSCPLYSMSGQCRQVPLVMTATRVMYKVDHFGYPGRSQHHYLRSTKMYRTVSHSEDRFRRVHICPVHCLILIVLNNNNIIIVFGS